jgi:Mrp family chromosome partitioning ATPase
LEKLPENDANYSENLDILFSGTIPPNAQLLTNTVFDLLIEEARTIYDFIIIDSAPVQMVSDTLNFSYLADVTVFITRASFSDTKSLLAIEFDG